MAILVGEGASLCVEPQLKCFSNCHVYDFYRPIGRGEVVGGPKVDGLLSIECYYQLLDDCYEGELGEIEEEGRGRGRVCKITVKCF